MENEKELVVLVTGAGKGAGLQAAQAFAARGDCVALNDIAPNNVEAALAEWPGRGYRGRAYVEDVSNRMAARALVHQVLEDWGRIDVLINHAAVEPSIPLLEMDEWDWQRTLDVNLTGAFLMTQAVGREMCSRGQGVILNLISLGGQSEARDRAAYTASQMGLIGLTRQAASELYSYGVRVHALGPGLARFQNAGGSVPRDLLEAVLFLASPAAKELNGMIVDTD